MIYATL